MAGGLGFVRSRECSPDDQGVSEHVDCPECVRLREVRKERPNGSVKSDGWHRYMHRADPLLPADQFRVEPRQ